MKISDETTAKAAIDVWQSKDRKEQLRNILMEIESLELNKMYYENRENKKGIIRSEEAIVVLIQRKEEVESGL